MAVVSIRYADALLTSAGSKEQKQYLINLQTLADLYQNDKEFKQVLINPKISDSEKLNIISNIVQADQTFNQFINLLLKEDRITLIADIYHKYAEKYNKLIGKINIQIIVADKISDEEIKKITKKYQDMYQAKEVSYQVTTDKNIIGGVKVIVNGKVYDASARTKLKGIFEN